MMLSTLLLALATAPDTTPTAPSSTSITIGPCAPFVVRTTWLSERRATVRTTTNGEALPSYPTHDERHLDRAIEVAACRNGVPQRLRVRYGEAFDKRLDQDPAPNGQEIVPGEPTYTTERSPLASRTFEIAQVGESAQVLLPGGSAATPAIGRLVLEAESITGGAVPLPGDTIARALGSEPREQGTAFAFDGLVARELLGGDETGECAATLTFLGTETSAPGRPRIRFEVRIVVRESPEGGFTRDADLRGFLLADAESGRPVEFAVEGSERKLAATSDARTATEIESTGTWRVKRGWDWR